MNPTRVRPEERALLSPLAGFGEDGMAGRVVSALIGVVDPALQLVLCDSEDTSEDEGDGDAGEEDVNDPSL